jgi:hypothetical protein
MGLKKSAQKNVEKNVVEQTATNKPVLLRYRSGMQHMPFTDVQSTSTQAAVR